MLVLNFSSISLQFSLQYAYNLESAFTVPRSHTDDDLLELNDLPRPVGKTSQKSSLPHALQTES